ncbi:arginase [Nocardioides sp. YR527]|uniref:arginase family protein n=1 Tax=Nocardioides sp. YR527 TaxID=1881028 RepID=UPI0008826B24|nr:arginase family protein [Nocardioides sp. YR527]SDK54795.1 arginase [Nocardioides sp. YR527]
MSVFLLDAPTNLGLRPPEPDAVPGCYKAPGALRDHGLLERLGAVDAGVVVPPRYHGSWDGRTTRNLGAIADYSRRLAGRLSALLATEGFPLVLGGDCSILIGSLLAVGEGSEPRPGLVFVDGHSDFRHPGNTDVLQAAAGEDLAMACGLADPGLGLDRPLVDPADVVVLGVRDDDEHLAEIADLGMHVETCGNILRDGVERCTARALEHLETRGVRDAWIHIDVDVLDPEVLPAVDSPAPGGLDQQHFVDLLATLCSVPVARGLEITVFDPDLDPTGEHAADLVEMLVAGLAGAGLGRGGKVSDVSDRFVAGRAR